MSIDSGMLEIRLPNESTIRISPWIEPLVRTGGLQFNRQSDTQVEQHVAEICAAWRRHKAPALPVYQALANIVLTGIFKVVF